MRSVFSVAQGLYPETITILPTYRCNAACEQCCFESNPDVEGRLSREELFGIIEAAKNDFASLRMVVFSGGECTLLKDDLYDAIGLATSLGLQTRIVTNAGWAKTARTAAHIADKLAGAGLKELNISTGLDHQKWVPLQSVIQAAQAGLARGITTLITIEKDSPDSGCLAAASSSDAVIAMLKDHPSNFYLLSNAWMPFNDRWTDRGKQDAGPQANKGCEQLFHNLVFTPYKEISACCGLTFEYIPELKIGRIGEGKGLASIYEEGLNDFLKIWVHVDGPRKIVKTLMGDGAESETVDEHVHICQSCVYMYQTPAIREAVRDNYAKHFPDVMARFLAMRRVMSRVSETASTEVQHREEVR